MAENPAEELAHAITDLYEVFRKYKLHPHVEGCPHCVFDDDHRLLHSAPLRLMGPNEFRRYAWKAMTTWGDVDDFKHFLPRLLELLSQDAGGGWVNPEVVFGKLTYGEFRDWPCHEQDAVIHFAVALWKSVLAGFPNPFSVDSLLCGIALFQGDLQEYLNLWRPDESPAAALHFAGFIESDLQRKSPAGTWRLSSSWWKDRDEQAQQVIAWVVAPEQLASLEKAFFATRPNDPDALTLSQAVQRLESLRSDFGY
jgi:hypothetical protein